MNFNEYQEKASRTVDKKDGRVRNFIHGAIGACTEAGEIADVAKRFMFYKQEIDWGNVKEEVGDILWYLSLICSASGITLEQAAEANIKKLKVRYPDNFNRTDAINRNHHAEREVFG